MTLAEDDASDASDAASVASVASQQSDATAPDEALTLETSPDQNLFKLGRLVKWSNSDISQRAKLDPTVAGWFNAPCFRKYMLEYLQEDVDDPSLERRHQRIATPEQCCNACNHDLGNLRSLPVRSKETQKPTAHSFAAFALESVTEWCREKAQDLVPQSRRRSDIVPAFWMGKKLQNEISRLMTRTRKPELPFTDLPSLRDLLPNLEQWDFIEQRGGGEALVAFCVDTIGPAHQRWVDYKADRAYKRATAAAEKRAAGSSPEGGPARQRARAEA